MKAKLSRLIPRKLAANLDLLIVCYRDVLLSTTKANQAVCCCFHRNEKSMGRA